MRQSGVLEPAALECGELGQRDGVVRDRSRRQSIGLVVQAKLLQVLERGGEVGGGGPGRAVLGRRLQASGGRHLWAAGFQGEQAGQVDDRGGSVGLEVDPAMVVAAQVVEEPERWAPPEGRHGQAAEEPPVAGGLADDPPKRRLGLQLAVELAEVDVGGRGQHRVLLRLLDPADELLLPGPQRDPPGRVGGHDVAGAADKPALLQGGRQVLGQGGEPAVGPRWGAIGHHQGVVLVGAERALPAAAAAEDQQRVRARRRAERRLAVTSGTRHRGHHGRWLRTG